MSDIEFDQEEHEVWEALAHLDDPDAIFTGSAPDAETRAYTELLGLLPLALEPVTPRAAVRRELLARIATRGAGAAVVPFPGPAERAPTERAAPPAYRRSFGGLQYAAAAMLTVSLLGLGYLFGKTQEQSATIARLEGDLRASRTQAELAKFSGAELEDLERRFKMVTEIARSAYPMHRVRDDGNAAGGEELVSGTVFVCGQHQRWYLNVRGLEPPPPEHEYHLWFVTDDGMIDGGAVELEGDTAELDAPQMPSGTHGFALSLETAGSHAKPEGDLVLIAENSVAL